MKRLCLVLAGLAVVSVGAIGCEPSSHGRYRQMTYNRVIDADELGLNEDIDTAVLLSERPTHLSVWYNR